MLDRPANCSKRTLSPSAVFLSKRAVIPERGEAASPEPMNVMLIRESAAVGPL
jgi:hypothetical protein